MSITISSTPATNVVPTDLASIPTQDQIAAEFGGDAAAQLAAMVFLFSRDRSRQSAERRDQIETQISVHQEAQVQKLHESADATYKAAVWNSAGAILQSSIQFAATGTKDSTNALLEASGNLTQSSFGLLGATHSREAANLQTDATHAGHKAGSYERSLESINTDADDAKSMKDAVYDFLQSVQESKAEGDKTLVTIRG